MGNNPYADGKIRGFGDAIAKAFVIGTAIFVATIVPFAWYWRVATFIALMFVIGIIYPAVQLALANRSVDKR